MTPAARADQTKPRSGVSTSRASNGSQLPMRMVPFIRSRADRAGGVPGAMLATKYRRTGSGSPSSSATSNPPGSGASTTSCSVVTSAAVWLLMQPSSIDGGRRRQGRRPGAEGPVVPRRSPDVLEEPLPGQPFDEFGERFERRAVEFVARPVHDPED